LRSSAGDPAATRSNTDHAARRRPTCRRASAAVIGSASLAGTAPGAPKSVVAEPGTRSITSNSAVRKVTPASAATCA
jgi:hypothetical protein